MNGSTFGLRLLSQRGPQTLILGMLAMLALAFRALQFLSLTSQIQWGYDFSAYWAAAGRLLDGLSPYTAQQLAGPYAPQAQYLYLYPPPLAAILIPLTSLYPTDYRAAAWLWAIDGAIILAAAVLALHRSEQLGARFPILAGRGRWLLVAAACAFPPVVGELVLGNVHLLLLGLLTLVWLGIRRGTRGGELAAGIAAGAATVVKVFPGVVVVWFLLTRRYRAALGALIGAAALIVITVPFTGIGPWRDYPVVLANLSAPSDTTDTLAPTVWLAPLLGFTVARAVVTLAGLAIVTWAARTLSEARSFAIAVVVSILVAPALYHHYLALLVLPFVLALGSGVPLKWLALSYLLMWGGQQTALGDAAWIVNRGMPTLGALVLLGALAVTGASRAAEPHAAALSVAPA